MCNSMATTPSTTPERKHPPEPLPPTFNALLAPEGQRITCTFCKQDHKSLECVVVTDLSERKDILKKQGRYFICLKRSHIAKNCDSNRGCSNCSQRHHSTLCLANETPGSGNSVAGVPQPSTQERRQPSSAISMYVDSKTSILLQTCIALASNTNSVQPQEKHCVRIILDSGSQKTYIIQQLKETLGRKPIARERLCITTFGSDCDNLRTVDVVNLCLKNLDNDVTVTITAHVVPMICSPLNYQAVQFARKSHAF